MTQQLTLKQLNRTTLQRQLLLQKQDLSVLDATNHLVGLQSQIPNPPYIGLWARLQNFSKSDLTNAIKNKQIVRAAMMRSTLHLVSAEMHQQLRNTLHPALEKAYRSFFGRKRDGIDIDRLITDIKPFLEEEPRAMGEIREFASQLLPNADPEAMAYAIRTYVPLLQVPPAGTWGTGTRASYTTAESWLGEPDEANLKQMFKLYLTAYAPASIMDFQAWAGLTNLTKIINSWQDEFTIYKHPNGRDLFDLPDLDITPEDTPVPEVIFLPEYENAIISYKHRDRILPDEYHKKVFLSAARVAAVILIDGFVGATWKYARNKDTATLSIALLQPVNKSVEEQIHAIGENLLKFIEEDAKTYQIEIE